MYKNKLDIAFSLRVNKQAAEDFSVVASNVGLSRNALINDLIIRANAAGLVSGKSKRPLNLESLVKQIGFVDAKLE